ncbi:MAG: hypothetical protein IPQ15_16405 [Betaproteobacteria bacterium]|nr:hypothetical protein [Betaproteobacteria bacterium]
MQTGVAPGTITTARAAVVRGTVRARDGSALPNVVVGILGHPEYGSTHSRADGAFDLAVNGGLRLTVDYRLAGHLPAQRSIDVPWQDYVTLPDVVLIPVDAQVTQVDLASTAPIQVARGSTVTDSDGTRRATVLFPQGLTAQMQMPDGSTQPLTRFGFRATEYTVGANGPLAMPGRCRRARCTPTRWSWAPTRRWPPGATSVQFDRPVPTYVENFLGFPVGTAVPAGYYDRARAAWVASADGRIVKLLGVTGGLADLDANGDGVAEDAAALAALGVTDAERATLATLYSPGQSLWRVPVTHFTPWDYNWPYGPPADAQSPADAGAGVARQDPEEEGSCQSQGSLVDCQNRALGEALEVAGSPYRLVYWSNRTPGGSRGIDITASGATVPVSLRSIAVQVSVAGQTSRRTLPGAPNQGFSFQWDGRDGYGRRIQGGQVARIAITYDYPAEYKTAGQFAQSFGWYGRNPVLVANMLRARFESTTHHSVLLGEGLVDARDVGLGGWTLDVHHFYDPVARELHLGDGRRRKADALGRVIDRVATAKAPTGGSSNVNAIAIAPDGSVYYIDSISDPTVVRRVAPDGTDTVFAGGGKRNPTPPPPYGENGPAIGATLFNPSGLAFGADGSLYIQDVAILRVGRDGIIRRVAGKDRLSPPHPGCPGATLAQGSVAAAINLCMQDFAVAPDGTIYFVERRSSPYTSESAYVMRIGPDGLVYRFAGNGVACPTTGSSTCGDGGPALAASFTSEFGGSLAVAPDGSVLIGDASSIRRVGVDGIISTIAGKRRQQGFSGDGGKARDALFCSATNFAVAPDGALWLNDRMNHRLRRIDTDGTVATIAGSGSACDFSPPISSGDGGPALRASIQNPLSIAIAPNGDAYVLDASAGTPRSIRRIAPTLPGPGDAEFLVPSADGGEIYEFAATGRHLRTRNALTSAVTREFGYDADGRLARVTEKTGATDNVTIIEHDATGRPGAIVGPYGQRTTLAVDANGFLASLTHPAGETHRFASTASGLLTAYTDPRGNMSSYAYDARGRLASTTDPSGGSQALAWSKVGAKVRVTRTTAQGRVSTIDNESLANGAHRRTVSFADGSARVAEDLADAGSGRLTTAEAVVTDVALAPDPRFGMPGAFPKSIAAAFRGRAVGDRECHPDGHPRQSRRSAEPAVAGQRRDGLGSYAVDHVHAGDQDRGDDESGRSRVGGDARRPRTLLLRPVSRRGQPRRDARCARPAGHAHPQRRRRIANDDLRLRRRRRARLSHRPARTQRAVRARCRRPGGEQGLRRRADGRHRLRRHRQRDQRDTAVAAGVAARALGAQRAHPGDAAGRVRQRTDDVRVRPRPATDGVRAWRRQRCEPRVRLGAGARRAR